MALEVSHCAHIEFFLKFFSLNFWKRLILWSTAAFICVWEQKHFRTMRNRSMKERIHLNEVALETVGVFIVLYVLKCTGRTSENHFFTGFLSVFSRDGYDHGLSKRAPSLLKCKEHSVNWEKSASLKWWKRSNREYLDPNLTDNIPHTKVYPNIWEKNCGFSSCLKQLKYCVEQKVYKMNSRGGCRKRGHSKFQTVTSFCYISNCWFLLSIPELSLKRWKLKIDSLTQSG